MSESGDALRAFAAECDDIQNLRGVVFVRSDDLTIHMGHANHVWGDREGIANLITAAKQAADHGTLKEPTVDEPGRLEAILKEP